MMNLLEFAFADHVRCAADPAAGERGLERGGEMKRMREEIIAHQNRRLVSPLGVDGRGVPADEGFVENIIMNKRGGVNHFDDGGEDVMVGPDLAAGSGGEQNECRPQAFAAESGALIDQTADERKTACQLGVEDAFGFGEIGGDGARTESPTSCAASSSGGDTCIVDIVEDLFPSRRFEFVASATRRSLSSIKNRRRSTTHHPTRAETRRFCRRFSHRAGSIRRSCRDRPPCTCRKR